MEMQAMSKVINIKTKKPIPIQLSLVDYIDYVDTIEQYLDIFSNYDKFKEIDFTNARKLLYEIRFCAMLNPKFRADTSDALVDIADKMYADIHTEE